MTIMTRPQRTESAFLENCVVICVIAKKKIEKNLSNPKKDLNVAGADVSYPGCCFCNGSHLSCVKPRWQLQRLGFLQFYNPNVHGHCPAEITATCKQDASCQQHENTICSFTYAVDFVLAFLFSISNYCSKAAGRLPQHAQFAS